MHQGFASGAAGRVARAADLIRDAASATPVLGTGLVAIDDALPWGGLPCGLHEIAAPSGDGAGVGFAVALMCRRVGSILWCRFSREAAESGAPYGPGLEELGLASERMILVEAPKPADLLWAMEEGLRANRLGCVLGERVTVDLTASRRLQLAAEAGNGVALLLSAALPANAPRHSSLAAVTRWSVKSIPSPVDAGGPGQPRWLLELWRCRGGGRPQSWMVEWNDATLSLDLVSDLADRPLAAATA